MIRATSFAIALLAQLPASATAPAQDAGAPEPIVRTTVDPPRVVVGQKMTLRVEVLAPNYMTSPPILPDFQVRNAITRQLANLNINERHEEMTYAGVRFEFAIYPQEPGSYAIAEQSVAVKYAAEPPNTRAATLPLPRIEFEAFIPDAAAQLQPFVSATKLTVEQVVQRSSDNLKVGDAVTRRVTVTAEGTPAMLLPPLSFPSADGLALYPAQPSLQDSVDRRTDVLSATRQDSATYMLERPGDYLLPAIAIDWWNVVANKTETASVDAVALHVLDNPGASPARSEGHGAAWSGEALFGFVMDHWLPILAGLAAILGLIWVSPRAARTIAVWGRRHRDAYLASESYAFACLLAAARHRDAGKLYFALMNWLARFGPTAPSHTITALKAAAQNPNLERQLDAIERCLFAPQAASQDWSARKLIAALSLTRLRLLRRASRPRTVRNLPQEINPTGSPGLAGNRWRPVAR
jgi:hypothetical protein